MRSRYRVRADAVWYRLVSESDVPALTPLTVAAILIAFVPYALCSRTYLCIYETIVFDAV